MTNANQNTEVARLFDVDSLVRTEMEFPKHTAAEQAAWDVREMEIAAEYKAMFAAK